MDKIKQQIEQSKLLVAKVLGSLSEGQERELEKWENSASNKKIEEDILNEESFKDWNDKMDRFDSSVHWEQFLNRMQESKKNGKLIRLQLFRRIASVAAVLIIGFTSYLTYEFINNNTYYQSLAEAEITPGSTTAQLILADGEVVNLETSKENTIREGSISIQNSKGILVYDEGEQIEQLKPLTNTLKIPRGGEYRIVLPDGTKVMLNAESELRYPVHFAGNTRQVYLKGEGYFEVKSNKEKPFLVNSGEHQVKVYGTEFGINSYDEINIKTVLVEGSIGLKSNMFADEKMMKPGQLALSNVNDGSLSIKEVDVRQYTAWKDGQFVFYDQNLEDILNDLARWYDFEIDYEEESLKKMIFTIDVQRYNNISVILKALESVEDIKFEIQNREIYVKRKE